MKAYILSEHEKDCIIERDGDNMLILKVEPHLFRDLSNYISKDKDFFVEVSMEIQDQLIVNKENDGREESKE